MEKNIYQRYNDWLISISNKRVRLIKCARQSNCKCIFTFKTYEPSKIVKDIIFDEFYIKK